MLQDHKRNHGDPPNDVEEAILLIKALRRNTMSKLTYADARRFQDLCVDLFPGVTVKDIEYAELEIHIREAMEEMKLKRIDTQIAKRLQFHEACNQRMGVNVVGPSGCGKSTIGRVLENAYKRQHKKYVVHIMNPKSITRVRLLGHMDHDTREWFDGVLTASARKVIKEPAGTHNWIICDGDIDPESVEALNNVLDSNRLLTMPNSKRIQFGTNVNFIFEADNLRFASPGTISRLSVIFFSEEDDDVKPIVGSWIAQQPLECQGSLATWFDSFFHRALDWIYKGPGGGQLATKTTTLGMVQNVLEHIVPRQKKDIGEDKKFVIAKTYFLLAVCRGFAGNLPADLRHTFVRKVCKWAGESLPDSNNPLNLQLSDGQLVRYEEGIGGTNVTFQAVRRSVVLPPLVQAGCVLQNMDLFKTWLADEQPIIVSGLEGCGKNLLIRHSIRRLQDEFDLTFNVSVLHCNARTSSKDVLQKLRQDLVPLSRMVQWRLRNRDVGVKNCLPGFTLSGGVKCGRTQNLFLWGLSQCVRLEVAVCLLKCREHRVLQKRCSSRAMSHTHATQDTSLVDSRL